MLSLLAAAALGFSLEGHDLGHGRQLADNHEPCKAGCDAGHDASCDEQDLAGRWTRSCDMHPTTSCDEDCHYSPPPPMAPWLGEHGTYPSPPPPISEPNHHTFLIISLVALLVALAFLCCICLGASTRYGFGHGTAVERGRYWCCCFLPSRRDDDSWYYDERREEAALARAAAQQEAEELALTGELAEEEVANAPAQAVVGASAPGFLPSLNHLK
jgi:hypothetical protein